MSAVARRTNTAIPTCRHESYLGKAASNVLGKITQYWDEVGHNCTGHNHTGHNYIGHNYAGKIAQYWYEVGLIEL